MSHLLADPDLRGHRARLCRELGLSRATVYRHLKAPPVADPVAETALRDRLQEIALTPRYGYRRITEQLHREGIRVNRKKVLRLMREDNLLCLRKTLSVRTTQSDPGAVPYPNLMPKLCICHPDQVWVADITYIRLPRQFVYLAVVLDVFTRRCVGWAIATHLQGSLTLAALQMALEKRPPPLYHHSDRGVQYTCRDYVDTLVAAGVQLSMSRKGKPGDNAFAESFIKTIKYEQVLISDYETYEEVLDSLPEFLEKVYNQQRLHSALGYRPPAEFEDRYYLQHNTCSPYLTVSQ